MRLRRKDRKRRGLAPLEMVLALPLLLFCMALIINFGTVATWKVRSLSVARHTAWGRRSERSAHTDQRPLYWPPSPEGRVSGGGGSRIDYLDDPRVDHPVIRGPMVGTIAVRRDLLDPSKGEINGTATLGRELPLLSKLKPTHPGWDNRRVYVLKGRSELVDYRWRFHDMGLEHNNDRRTVEPDHDPLYKFPPLPSLENAYGNAIRAAAMAYYDPAFDVLDREVDFVDYPYLLRFVRGHSPNFHPRPKGFCTYDRAVTDKIVEDLVDKIQGRPENGDEKRIPNLAESMASRFKGYYEGVIRQIEQLLQAEPPEWIHPNPGALQAEIPVLEQKVDDLEKYIQQVQQAQQSQQSQQAQATP